MTNDANLGINEAHNNKEKHDEQRGPISPHFTFNIALFQKVIELKEFIIKLLEVLDFPFSDWF
jgi:hypothetical protein